MSGDDSITRTSQLNVGTSADVSLKIAETDLSSLAASIRAPSGNEEPCLLKRLPNRHLGEMMAVNLKYNIKEQKFINHSVIMDLFFGFERYK